jgi:hypothetical protein
VNNSVKAEVKNRLYLIFNPCIPLISEISKEFVPKSTSKWVKGEIMVFFQNKKFVSFWNVGF